jgi:hypothetical protein
MFDAALATGRGDQGVGNSTFKSTVSAVFLVAVMVLVMFQEVKT